MFRTTWVIIRAGESGDLPDKIMITIHPRRWTDNPVDWTKELLWQNTKSIAKSALIAYRKIKARSR